MNYRDFLQKVIYWIINPLVKGMVHIGILTVRFLSFLYYILCLILSKSDPQKRRAKKHARTAKTGGHASFAGTKVRTYTITAKLSRNFFHKITKKNQHTLLYIGARE